MNLYHICNGKGRVITTKYSAQEARDYLIGKGTKFGSGVKRRWYIRTEFDKQHIVAQVIIDQDTAEQVSVWPWSIDYKNPSINYATQEVAYLNSLVGRGRYVLKDILATVH